MPVPSYDLPTGMYFRSIEGYTASDFEIAKLQNGLSFQPACVTPGVAYFIDSSGNTTDMNSLAIMPCRYSPPSSWYSIDSIMASYFSTSFDWSPESSRVGYNFIRHTTPTRDYPLSLAKKGYRTYSWSRYYFEDALLSLDGAERTILGAIEYMFWSNPIISKANTDSESAFEIKLTSSGYSCSDGTEGTWKDYQGTEISRKWVGVVLQAGGGAGGKGWWGHDGGGASAGAFWCGIVYLGGGSITITVEAYNATGDGREGSRITLSRGGSNWLLVERGQYPFGNNKGTSQGGDVTFYSGNYTTFAYSKGGNGSGNGLGTGTNLSTFYAQTPDQSNIPFAPMGGGFDAPNGTGSGGGSVIGRGANGGGWNTEGADAGAGLSNPNHYGAGGGGGGWWGRDGGSGGYPYFVIGY